MRPGLEVLFKALRVCVHLYTFVCVGGRQGHVAVLNTTAVSGSERSAFVGVVGPVKPFGLFI